MLGHCISLSKQSITGHIINLWNGLSKVYSKFLILIKNSFRLGKIRSDFSDWGVYMMHFLPIRRAFKLSVEYYGPCKHTFIKCIMGNFLICAAASVLDEGKWACTSLLVYGTKDRKLLHWLFVGLRPHFILNDSKFLVILNLRTHRFFLQFNFNFFYCPVQ